MCWVAWTQKRRCASSNRPQMQVRCSTQAIAPAKDRRHFQTSEHISKSSSAVAGLLQGEGSCSKRVCVPKCSHDLTDQSCKCSAVCLGSSISCHLRTPSEQEGQYQRLLKCSFCCVLFVQTFLHAHLDMPPIHDACDQTGLETKKLECNGAQSTFEHGFCDQAVQALPGCTGSCAMGSHHIARTNRQVNKAWYKYLVCYRAAGRGCEGFEMFRVTPSA